MRGLHRRTTALAAAALVTASFAVAGRLEETSVREGLMRTSATSTGVAPAGALPSPLAEPAPEPAARATGPGAVPDGYRATCRTVVDGSHATAYCHNPYPVTDRVRLHVECARWWDIDADSAPADVGPAGYVRLSERCWKEIGTVWVSHEAVRAPRSS